MSGWALTPPEAEEGRIRMRARVLYRGLKPVDRKGRPPPHHEWCGIISAFILLAPFLLSANVVQNYFARIVSH
jgi:hypothetical protein